jgi:indolepyruvate ferredoxin oxidoreductase
VALNRKAFQWGRCIAVDPARVDRLVSGGQVIQFHRRETAPTLDELVARRAAFLTDYQGAALAKRYTDLVDAVRAIDAAPALKQRLTTAVAHGWFKLLAVKDEWEVARLYTSDAFRKELEQTFEGDYTLHFHVGAWPFARTDPTTGRPVKREVGPWLMRAFGVMAKLRGLRGSWLDPFRNGEERRLDATLRTQYEQDVRALIAGLTDASYDTAVAIASLPAKIRGFGHVRQASADTAGAERARLLQEFSNPIQQIRRAG